MCLEQYNLGLIAVGFTALDRSSLYRYIQRLCEVEWTFQNNNSCYGMERPGPSCVWQYPRICWSIQVNIGYATGLPAAPLATLPILFPGPKCCPWDKLVLLIGRQGESFHPVLHWPSACNSCAWASLICQKPGIQSECSCGWQGGNHLSHRPLTHRVCSNQPKQKWNGDLNPGCPTWDAVSQVVA